MKHWFPISLGLLLCACSGPPSPPPAQGVTVGPNVMVSAKYSNRQHHEMLSAVDPLQPNRMLACVRTFTHDNVLKNVVYRSLDGGQSWLPVFEDPVGVDNGDPACDWGLGDTAYYAALDGKVGSRETDALNLYSSHDAGSTWRLAAPHPFVDREYITVDKTHSRYRGRVYVYGNQGRIMVLRGHSLNPEIFPPVLAGYTISSPSPAVVADDGTILYPLWAIKGAPKGPVAIQSYVAVAWSRDGGHTVSRPRIIGNSNDCPHHYGVWAGPAAIDRSSGPFHGRIYFAWEDATAGRCLINVASSDNVGVTWSPPILLHDDVPRSKDNGPDQWEPAIAVNNRGVVAVSWYDTRTDPANAAYTLRMAVSRDGGASFDRSFAVSTSPYDATRANPYFVSALTMRGGAYDIPAEHPKLNSPIDSQVGPDFRMGLGSPGDTRDMPADATGIFHPFWFDNRSGTVELYTARVAVTGSAWRNGDPSLAGYRDVTNDFALRYTYASFDPTSGTVGLTVKLLNRSGAAVRGPIAMRMLWTDSDAGLPRATNAANGKSGPGAIWNFAVPSVGAGAFSAPIPLQFTIDNLDHTKIAFPLLRLETRLYAR